MPEHETPSRPFDPLRRWLFGTAPTTWSRSAAWYLRMLAVIYAVAFVSLWVQIVGLIGQDGVQPIKPFLAAVRDNLGHVAWWRAPTLCWLNSSDGFLSFQCAAGVALSALALAGVAQVPVFALLWLLYLSLTVAGQQFLGYQWDNLLLEAGLLAIFLSPLQWLAWHPRWAEPPRITMWLQRWLIFRLMFLSGVVKLASDDPTWRSLTAMTYHYWTQPIPPWTAWYASHWPLWFQKASCFGVFVSELGLPPLVFGPRRVRTFAAFGIITFQLLIIVTGNYGFFNLLTIALCVPLMDDSILPRLWPRARAQTADRKLWRWPAWLLWPVAALIVPVTSMNGLRQCDYSILFPSALQAVAEAVSPLRSMNGYGLFASMTTQRPELIVEGSDDGAYWREYLFKWKAGPLNWPPRFCVPHMPRLDWQMWFAALDPNGNSDILEGLFQALLHGQKPVLNLLQFNPFPDHPPRYVRAKMYLYTFTTSAQRAKTGEWWQRTDTGEATGSYTIAGK